MNIESLRILILLSSLLLISCGGASTSVADSNPNGVSPSTTPEPNNSAESQDSTEEPTADSEAAELQLLQEQFRLAIIASSEGRGLEAYILPDSDDYNRIPQDPSNPITAEKVLLGQMLFHDTAFSIAGRAGNEYSGTWSCATCHNSQAGFKPGVPQGIGEGGQGYGANGALRTLLSQFDPLASSEAADFPDIQPIAVPSVLNSGYQNVKLWDGELGNPIGGSVNSTVGDEQLLTADTLRAENSRFLAGLETQAVAGIPFHRMVMEQSTLESTPGYAEFWPSAFGANSLDYRQDAALAIAAFERTLLANEAPFQRWLRGERDQLNTEEIHGGILFFGKAGCTNCHQGPALSSDVFATEAELFFNIGFADFNLNDPRIHGTNDAKSLGRGGFTQDSAYHYHFKIPQLYNLNDAPFYGHGSSFRSIRDVLVYKNVAIPQNFAAAGNLSEDFVPLGLTEEEIDALTSFLTNALRDPNLARYEPRDVPSGSCVTVDPLTVESDWRCEHLSN
ncbi:MAG: cytochrome-c peroxidase [Gammaproteobacteria bacterium]|nr:cytochrome-c peroxidase [Gammaproteobacteria bacterium]